MTEEERNSASKKQNHKRYPDDSFKGQLRELYEALVMIKNDGILGKIILVGGSLVIGACSYMAVSGSIKEIKNQFSQEAQSTETIQAKDHSQNKQTPVIHLASLKSNHTI